MRPFFILACLTSAVGVSACLLDRAGTLGGDGSGGETATGGDATGGNPAGGDPVGGSPVGGSSAGGAQGGNAGGAGGEGGSVGAENCLNGVDDNGNGAIDCEDAACSDFSCFGPVSNALEYVIRPNGACPTGTTEVDDHVCQGCACTAQTGTCAHTVDAFSDAACTQGVFVGGTMTGCFNEPDGERYYTVTSLTPMADSNCAASGTPTSATTTICELPDGPGQCDNGRLCIPNTGVEICALIPTNEACPSGLSDAGVLFQGAAGACSCECNVETTTCGNLPFELFPQDGCSGVGTSYSASVGMCTGGAGQSLSAERAVATPTCSVASTSTSVARGRMCCGST